VLINSPRTKCGGNSLNQIEPSFFTTKLSARNSPFVYFLSMTYTRKVNTMPMSKLSHRFSFAIRRVLLPLHIRPKFDKDDALG